MDGKPASAPLQMSLQPLGSAVGLAVLNFIGREPSTRINIQQDGSFTIPSVPESTYRLEVTILSPLSATAYIADMRQQGTSIYDDGLAIGASAVSPIEVVVNTNGGAVQGTVVGPNQQPFAAGALVALIPPPNRRQNPALYRTAVSGSQGEFKLSAVPPGSYKLFAWETVPHGAYQNPEFMETFEARGIQVTVQGGATTSQNLTVISAPLAQ